MGALLEVQVLPRADHIERSEVLLRELESSAEDAAIIAANARRW